MSTSSIETLTCLICGTDFDANDHQPVALPACGHTFCRPCVLRLDRTQRILRCPTCRTPHEGESPSRLPTNYLLLDIIGSIKKTTTTPNRKRENAECIADEEKYPPEKNEEKNSDCKLEFDDTDTESDDDCVAKAKERNMGASGNREEVGFSQRFHDTEGLLCPLTEEFQKEKGKLINQKTKSKDRIRNGGVKVQKEDSHSTHKKESDSETEYSVTSDEDEKENCDCKRKSGDQDHSPSVENQEGRTKKQNGTASGLINIGVHVVQPEEQTFIERTEPVIQQPKHVFTKKKIFLGLAIFVCLFSVIFGLAANPVFKAHINGMGFTETGIRRNSQASKWQSEIQKQNNGRIDKESPFSVMQRYGQKGVHLKLAVGIGFIGAAIGLITGLLLSCCVYKFKLKRFIKGEQRAPLLRTEDTTV